MMKKFMATLTAVAMLLSLAACSPGDDSSSASSPSSTTTEASSGASTAAQLPTKDRAGNDIIVPEKVNTVVSLAPSVTQLLSDLGVADKIVGIDTQSPMYSNQLKEGLPQFDMMNIDAEALIALKPDIVFVSGISYVGGTDPLKSVRDAGICVVDIPSSTSHEGVQLDNQFIGDCVGKSEEVRKINADMQTTIDEISEIGKTITNKKTVLFEIAPSPSIYSFGKGTFLHEMLEVIGAENVLADQESWVAVSEESAIAANPDVILTNVNYTADPVGEAKAAEGWSEVNAVKNDQIFQIDNAASSLPNHHVVDALIQMAVAVYPEEYAAYAK